MGRRSRRRGQRESAPASTTDYRDPEGNVLTLRDSLTAGTLRLVQLAGGPELVPADDRFAGFPLPLVVHIVGAAGGKDFGATLTVTGTLTLGLFGHPAAYGFDRLAAGFLREHPGLRLRLVGRNSTATARRPSPAGVVTGRPSTSTKVSRARVSTMRCAS